MAGDGAAAVGALVVVAIYEHRDGSAVRAFKSEEQALEWRTDIAEQRWDDEFDDEPPARADIGEAYFDSVEGEYFSVRPVQVEGRSRMGRVAARPAGRRRSAWASRRDRRGDG